MTYQESGGFEMGQVSSNQGRVTEVLAVERRGPDVIYFRLAGFPGAVIAAAVQTVPPSMRARAA